MPYAIHPLFTGTCPTGRADVMYHPSIHRFYDTEGEVDTPVMAYYVEGEGRKLLVDTGMSDTATARLHVAKAEQPPGCSIVEQLGRLGVKPEEIDAVILTHLHWDHCANLERFGRAAFYVQRIEYEFALEPIPVYYRIYEHPSLGFSPPILRVRFALLDGETRIFPGIRAYPSIGHSIGHQSVAIETAAGIYHCCGDLIHTYDNLNPIPELGYEVSPPARYEVLHLHWHSLCAVKKAADKAHILPAHELSMRDLYEKGVI